MVEPVDLGNVTGELVRVDLDDEPLGVLGRMQGDLPVRKKQGGH